MKLVILNENRKFSFQFLIKLKLMVCPEKKERDWTSKNKTEIWSCMLELKLIRSVINLVII